ncbi:MAG: OmpA family protein [Alphaproteobacteria bacterium]|nr:OmpA family protein [Alphaproteobacteria bacterium]
MTLKAAMLGSAFALACAGTATAAHIDGWYIGLEGGANWVDDWSHTNNGAARTATYETGWLGLATVGYGWNHFRLEFEAGYRDNDLESYLNNVGVPIANSAGTLWEATAMVNVLYDLSLTDKLSLSLGAGAGGDFSNAELTLTIPGGTAEDDNWNFAYQGIAGINYMVTRRTQLFMDYRYLRVMEPDYRLVFPGPATRTLLGDDYGKHAATFGIRYALQPAEAQYVAPPPPPPPPTSSGAPPRQFIVFFGYNKYTLTSEAQRVISEAVTTAKQGGSASILITGHTDTMGSNSYNQRLSVRRSNTVRAEMVSQGIPNGSITSTGRGETELLVQTADSVKEPQNRRATIDLN